MFGTEFRPTTFGDVLGLSDIKEIVQAVLRTAQYDPGYLLVGPFSCGKTTMARLVARSILCENRREDMSPCNECRSCKDFLENRNPGYLEIDAANNGTKDKIQEIKEGLQYESLYKHRIVLFDEAHNISKEGKDALLTQLEQRNSGVIFIFCTTEPEKMPETISSRCVTLHFPEPTEAEVITKLKKICEYKAISYTEDGLFLITKAVGRHYRDAENLLHTVALLGGASAENAQKAAGSGIHEVATMVLSLPNDLVKAIDQCNQLVSRMTIKRIYEDIIRVLKDSILVGAGLYSGNDTYDGITKMLYEKHGQSLFEILEYILTKNRFNDLTLLQSDLLVLHYRFVKGSFAVKQTPDSTATKGRVEPQKRDGKSEETLTPNMPPWDRDSVLRGMKVKKTQAGSNEKVPERVSAAWGPDVKSPPPSIPRNKVSMDEFRKIVGGNAQDAKI